MVKAVAVEFFYSVVNAVVFVGDVSEESILNVHLPPSDIIA